MNVPYGNLLGRALKLLHAGDAAAADAICQHVVAVDPRNATALHLAGVVAHELADHARSFAMMNRAIEVQPDLDDAHCGRGIAQRHLGRPDAAVADFERAVALNPRNAQALYYLGLSRLEHNDLPAAAEKFEAALAVEPRLAMALTNLGLVRDRQGRLDEAANLYRQAIDVHPGLETAHNNLAATLQKLGKVDEALAILRRLDATTSDPIIGVNLLTCLHLLPGDNATFLREAKRWAARFADPLTPAAPPFREPAPNRRLRIGYVAVDGLRRHSLAMTYWPLLEAHDPAQVEVFAYSDLPENQEDDVTRRIKAVTTWRRTAGLSDSAFADRVRTDNIDILVDGIGFAAGTRLLAEARRPAPIQVHFPVMSTTGMTAMDYVIGDQTLLPAGSEAAFSEKICRLPCCYLYRPLDDLPPLIEPPCVRNGYVTFGSFNRLTKIGSEAVATWAAVLKAVPGSRLLIKSSGGMSADAIGRCRGLLREHGVAADAIAFQPSAENADGALKPFNDVDIALDSLPFCGVLTTFAALAMGVPVVTWCGQRVMERYGAAILGGIGFTEGLATDRASYVAKAVALASDVPHLKALRSSLRGRLLASTFCDAPRFARSLESAYRSLWQRWCADVAKAAPNEAGPR